MNYDEPSSQTVQALDHCRKEFAATKGTTRNAIDQLFAGNTHDPYPPFRSHFKDVCATQEADPDAYLTDLLTIKHQFRPVTNRSVCDAFMEKLSSAHDLIETCTKALSDGQVDKDECRDIISKIGAAERALEELKQSALLRKNVLNGSVLPDEIKEKAQKLRPVR